MYNGLIIFNTDKTLESENLPSGPGSHVECITIPKGVPVSIYPVPFWSEKNKYYIVHATSKTVGPFVIITQSTIQTLWDKGYIKIIK